MPLIDDQFPVSPISDLAQRESWRKEIYRPIYHIHKWWAKRLGSIFRAVILSAHLPDDGDLMEEFYRPHQLGTVVYDPFMGGGTIVGEAIKLGCSVIGRDINPVSYNVVRAALGPIDRHKLTVAYEELEANVAPSIQELYQVRSAGGATITVLYYFWVKCLPCPKCSNTVELFSNYIFSRNAYPGRKPEARILCPECRGIFVNRYDATRVDCPHCEHHFDPREGPARGSKAQCRSCGYFFNMAATARARGHPPDHKQYAKLILDESGNKQYCGIWESDEENLAYAQEMLDKEGPFIPSCTIADGYNTRQVLNYGYTDWLQFFNERQLLALSRLARGILEIKDNDARKQLAILFSGTLEFNNMFASFKGEGTGAVRHMFAHHVLKPERTPLEANVWGTPSSSGSFSTLFRSRLLRALEYREQPFEVAVGHERGNTKTVKRYKTDTPFLDDVDIANMEYRTTPRTLHLTAGSSHETDIPPQFVDVVVTDPPFFDNVHYSELADFFYVWQAPFFNEPQMDARHPTEGVTTRALDEVQDTDVAQFSHKLRAVFTECERVMKPSGRMIFSYHHARSEGWSSVVEAVIGSKLTFIAAYPVVAEMAGATPKSQAKEPINLDIIFVCRKVEENQEIRYKTSALDASVRRRAEHYVDQLASVLPRLSRNDLSVIYRSQLIVEMSGRFGTIERISDELDAAQPWLEKFVSDMEKAKTVSGTDEQTVKTQPLF